jgi:hypothetical protein
VVWVNHTIPAIININAVISGIIFETNFLL